MMKVQDLMTISCITAPPTMPVLEARPLMEGRTPNPFPEVVQVTGIQPRSEVLVHRPPPDVLSWTRFGRVESAIARY